MFSAEMRKHDGSPRQIRSFYWTVGLLSIFVGAFLAWRGHTVSGPVLGLGTLLLVTGWIRPVLLKPVYRGWILASLCLGFVVSRILLSGVFYALLTPIALLARVTGHRFLNTRFREGVSSYWVSKKPAVNLKQALERQY